MQLPEITLRKIIWLIVLCFIVGFLLTSIGIRPDMFWSGLLSLAEWLFGLLKSAFRDGFRYLLAGAAVVLPIYAAVYLWKAWRKR